MAEAAPQAMTPAEKDETQASTQAESAVEATTTPVEEKAPETTATSSEEKEVASSNGLHQQFLLINQKRRR